MVAHPIAEKGPSALSQVQELVINGEAQPSSDGTTFTVRNPMTGQAIYECANATVDDYSRAIDTAHEAFKSWSATGPSARRLIFLKAAEIIESYLGGDAPEILSSEVSATAAWVRINMHATAGLFRETASLATHIRGEVVPADRPGTTILVERQAVGVVLAISPWNAPVNLTARSVACPLMCGNTVVVKPSEHSPKSQALVVRALLEAGLPPGAIAFLPTSPGGRAAEVTEYAVKHARVLRVNFTGSDRVGRIIAGHAAACLKQCVFELGGKAPVIVRADANLDDAVEAVVFGALAYSGQVCMSTERAIVHRSVAAEFRTKVLARIAALRCGNHLEDAAVSVSGLFHPAHALRVLELVRDALAGGAELLAGDLATSGPCGTIVRPHVLSGVGPSARMRREEVFGPVLMLAEFDTDDEAVAAANDTDYSLCASVFSRDVMTAMDLARRVRAGTCHVNGPTIYVESTLPNGGTGGGSGYGRFGGMSGVEAFTEKKVITLARPGMRFAF
ncbi:hypothetical protein RB594_001311 [Gaeumannomyces avenae]